MPVPVCMGVASRVLWLVGASVMSVLVMRLVPDSKYLANEGRKTLQYYLLHLNLLFLLFYTLIKPASVCETSLADGLLGA